MHITELPKEVLFKVLDDVDTPTKSPQRQLGSTWSTPSASLDFGLARRPKQSRIKSGGSFRPTDNATLAATQARLSLSETCRFFRLDVNAKWEESKILTKTQAWVATVSQENVASALARSRTSLAPEDMEVITRQVRSFFDEIREDPTFQKSIKYYIHRDRARRESTHDHPLQRYGANLAGHLPKPYDTEGKSKHIQLCGGFSGSTELFGKTVDLGTGKDKIHILLGYNMSHFAGSGDWEMDIISSAQAQKKVNAG